MRILKKLLKVLIAMIQTSPYVFKYAPLTRVTKKIKTHNESRLKKDILTSVSNKNRIYKKFVKQNTQKREIHYTIS